VAAILWATQLPSVNEVHAISHLKRVAFAFLPLL
jgi:hypothetical protein